MTKVTMNQTNLESAIKSLRDLADDCEISRDTIVRAYNADGDTLASQGYREPEDFSASVNTAVQTVRDRADTIEKYKDNIVALNESGTASMDADGVITLTLPDDPTDFASWAQATIDANDLKSLTESSDMTATSPSGRTYDQVIDSIRANSTDSGGYDADHRAAYSDALITAIGPENLTSLPISAQQHFLYNPPTGKEVNTRPEAGGAAGHGAGHRVLVLVVGRGPLPEGGRCDRLLGRRGGRVRTDQRPERHPRRPRRRWQPRQ